MKKGLYLLTALILALLFPAAMLTLRSLPTDAHGYIAQKYAGWNGVLQAWVCMDWEGSGSIIRWLNGCAARFEKENPGVYIEFTPVSRDTLRRMHGSGLRLPELIYFSPGELTEGTGLLPLSAPTELRDDLAGCGRGLAQPVAMGGYIWVFNTALTDGPQMQLPLTLLPDDEARCFSAGLLGLLEDAQAPTTTPPEPGIDLGLPAAAFAELTRSEEALEQFINGELSCLVVTQKELARLVRLRDAGRGPDWSYAATGSFAFTDQLLLQALVDVSGDDGDARSALAADFARSLYEENAQSGLSDIGLFSITGEYIHGEYTGMHELELLINSRPLVAPDCFSEYSIRNSAAIVRSRLRGEISSMEALKNLLVKISAGDLQI